MFPVEPQSPIGKNINLHKMWVFRRFQKECQKAQFSALFRTFWHSFCIFGNPPLFGVQISVFAVGALRLDRKYTSAAPVLKAEPSNL